MRFSKWDEYPTVVGAMMLVCSVMREVVFYVPRREIGEGLSAVCQHLFQDFHAFIQDAAGSLERPCPRDVTTILRLYMQDVERATSTGA